MRTLEIALWSDDPRDHRFLDETLLNYRSAHIAVRHESPLDLLLRDTISWFAVRKAPDAVICTYRSPFQELKIVADLKKRPSYQWVPVFMLVNEDISHTRARFLEYGVSEVLPWPQDSKGLAKQIYRWLDHVYMETQLPSAG